MTLLISSCATPSPNLIALLSTVPPCPTPPHLSGLSCTGLDTNHFATGSLDGGWRFSLTICLKGVAKSLSESRMAEPSSFGVAVLPSGVRPKALAPNESPLLSLPCNPIAVGAIADDEAEAAFGSRG